MTAALIDIKGYRYLFLFYRIKSDTSERVEYTKVIEEYS